MSRQLRAHDSRAPGRRQRAASTLRGLLAAATLLLLSGCTGRDLGFPTGASSDTEPTAQLWLSAWVAAGVIGIFVFGLIIWAPVRYRRRSEDEIPPQVRYNLPIEVLYTVAPIIVVLVFFFHTIQTDAELQPTEEPTHTVQVLAQKWSWAFTYVEEDAVGGESVFSVGDTANRPTLMLPVGEPVQIDLRSQDVIHSFWVPAFYYKQDVVPGRKNSFAITPTREGTYEGRCSELCGLHHSRMLFTLEVVDRDTYDAHLQDLQEAGNVGTADGASVTDDIVGLDEEDEAGSSEEGAPE
ncbi:cytochrome c oxidase subunit II [soil metagenome]